jgi:NOL1/NOP2/sun family putative RNA methylase
MRHLLGAEFPAFLASYDAPPDIGLRVNTLKIAPERFRSLVTFELKPVPWCPAGFIVTAAAEPGKHPYHTAGLYYLQDPSALAVAEILAPQPGEKVLDLAAAPGGKATHIAALMRGEGLLIANEIHHRRVWDLAENLERWGARNAAITNTTPERLAERLAGFFDAVLVDAPCSGEGLLRRSEVARREWSPELIGGCALRQSAILASAARLVRPGGRLVYATCTFAPEENEGTVGRFLAAHPEFELVEPPVAPGFAPGRPEWGAEALLAVSPPKQSFNAPERPELTRGVRLWPHLAPGEGHFVALLHKAAIYPERPAPLKPWRPPRLPRSVEAAYRDFCATNLTAIPVAERLALVGSYLYALPADVPDFSLPGLSTIHPGWWLGTLKSGRFEPSHALALALRLQDVLRFVSLPAASSELAAYLRGAPFRHEGDDGWTLVAADGFPLGWGRRVGGIVKSKYPKGLRWV